MYPFFCKTIIAESSLSFESPKLIIVSIDSLVDFLKIKGSISAQKSSPPYRKTASIIRADPTFEGALGVPCPAMETTT